MNIDSFDYFPAPGKEYDMILWLIASEMNDFRVIAKKERFLLTQKENNDLEFNIKLLDQSLTQGSITYDIYTQKHAELVKNIPNSSTKLQQAVTGQFLCAQEYENARS